jgi:hypothetical protein
MKVENAWETENINQGSKQRPTNGQKLTAMEEIPVKLILNKK